MFAERLNDLLKEKNISQNQLSKKIGFTQSTISKWILKKSEPTETAIRNCAIYFNVTTDYLLGLEDEIGNKSYSTKYHIQNINNSGNINMS